MPCCSPRVYSGGVLFLRTVAKEKTDMERTVTKLRGDLATCNEELSQRTLQLSQLRKREYATPTRRRTVVREK